MDSSDEELMLAAAAVAIIAGEEEGRQQDKRKDRVWEGPICSRKKDGAYRTIVPHLIVEGDDDDDANGAGDDDGEASSSLPRNRVDTFNNYFRMSRTLFEELLQRVGPTITKQDTQYRLSIPPEERLMVTLRYLATGASMTEMHYNWRISKASLSHVIPEVCCAIYSQLREDYVSTPTTTEEWGAISAKLAHRSNFPNSIGAIDGKHILINKPWQAGSQFHNYKGTESIVLMAMCDADYKFTYIDVGAQGRVSDGGVFNACTLSNALTRGNLNIPLPTKPPNGDAELPYVILGDEAFPLKTYLLRPYARRQLDHDKRIFNYRLSRTRRLIENAFGILTAVWRIFATRITLQPNKVEDIVKACCALHNFLRHHKQTNNITVDTEAAPGNWRQHQAEGVANIDVIALRPTEEAKAVRDQSRSTSMAQVPYLGKRI